MNRAKFVQKLLNQYVPNTPIPLIHHDPYTLLIAVLLSAQSTDKRVNLVTVELFARASTPKQMIELSIEEIEDIIRPCGLGPKKAKSIWNLSHDLISLYDGNVPSSLDALEKLPGVGHKTASVVVAQAFGIPAFPVDTHIHRCSKRWGLSSGKNVIQTEKDLKKLFPKASWNKLHLQIIYYARSFCPARGHDVEKCPICKGLLLDQ